MKLIRDILAVIGGLVVIAFIMTICFSVLGPQTPPNEDEIPQVPTDPDWIEKITTTSELVQGFKIVRKEYHDKRSYKYAEQEARMKSVEDPDRERDQIMDRIKKTEPDAYALWYFFSDDQSGDHDLMHMIEKDCAIFKPLRDFNEKYYGPDRRMSKWEASMDPDPDDLLIKDYQAKIYRLKQVALRIYEKRKCS